MDCQHPGCKRKARRMIGYRKWCGACVNVEAVCAEHTADAEKMVKSILDGHSAGFATPYNREIGE